MDQFVMGAIAMASFVAGLFFLRFWRDTGDRLFAVLAAAFWLLGATRIALAWTHPAGAEHQSFYWVRLIAYGLIIVGIIDKNRTRAPR